MTKIKNMIPYLVVVVAAFYLLPLLIQDTGTGILILIAAIPLICLCTSVLYGYKNSFSLLFVLLNAILFIPSLFIFYNSSAWVYIVGYGVIALIGNLIGMAMNKSARKTKDV